MKASVIFTTYNSPAWLQKVLWGYKYQTEKDFQLIVADDGSGTETAETIEEMRSIVDFPIVHVWHPDEGFRKCKILNDAIRKAEADYIVFSDGDCIPRSDFLQTHLSKRKEGYFLSGGAVRLPMRLSQRISADDIKTGRAFDKKWLVAEGLKLPAFKKLKLTANAQIAGVLNKISPTGATWNGGNASAWKSDILRVNGFDERMKYGAEDREFGERLMNSGIKPVQIRYSAICLHLDHSRGYVNETDLRRNAEIRRLTKKEKHTWTSFGIDKQDRD